MEVGTEKAWEAGWYEECDKPGMLAIDRQEYGNSGIASETHLDWVCTGNPVGSPIIPVAREKESGRVIGFQFHVPVRFSCQCQELLAWAGVNVVVDRAYRRQGVFEAVQTMALNEGKRRGGHFFYTLPNTRSLAAVKKWNYTVVASIPLVIRPLNMVTLTQERIHNRSLRWGINVGWKVAGTIIWRERYPGRLDSSLRIVEETELDDGYDQFWEQIKGKYHLMLIRDRAFLQWRFRDIPLRTYQILSVRQGSDIKGYIILREAKIRGGAYGLIADFMVVPGEQGDRVGGHLLHEAMQRFRATHLPVVGGLVWPHTQEFSIMRRSGLLECPRRFAPQSFHVIAQSLSERTPPDMLAQASNWYVSIADHDAV